MIIRNAFLLSFLLVLFLPFSLYGACPCSYTRAYLIEVIDGDTIWLLVEGSKIRIQIADIRAPDLFPIAEPASWCEEEGEKAALAQNFVRQHLGAAKEILHAGPDDRHASGSTHENHMVDVGYR